MSFDTITQTIPLNRLVHSRANVRHTGRDIGIEPLKASIAAHGLRQNLNVRATTGNRFEVVAGGRRLQALKSLVKDGTLPRDFGIPCAVLSDDDNAAEISLAENTIRQDMHPDDQCTAFAELVAQGMSVDDIGARFGITGTLVTQRLKLASVSPVLRKRFRAGDLDLAQMMAFALVDDHTAQEAVWNDLPEWNNGADAIRRALTSNGLSADHRLARFVGIDVYEAEGGTVLRDLFESEQPAVLADGALVERLAMRRLEEEAAHLQLEGWSWVKIAPKPDYMTSYGRVYPSQSEDDDSEKLAFSAEDKARAGARITLSPMGDGLLIERGLILPETVKAEARKKTKASDTQKSLPETLVAELTSHRTAALRLTLTNHPAVALAATVHALALDRLYLVFGQPSCLDLTAHSDTLIVRSPAESPDHEALAQKLAAWEATLPPDPDDLWDWVLLQDQSMLLDLLAFIAAMSINAVTRNEGDTSARIRSADSLAKVLDLNMSEHWTPSFEGFVSRLSKAQMAAALREAGKPEQADLLTKLGKPEAAARTAKHLAGTGWLPVAMKVTPRTAPDDEDQVGESEADDLGSED